MPSAVLDGKGVRSDQQQSGQNVSSSGQSSSPAGVVSNSSRGRRMEALLAVLDQASRLADDRTEANVPSPAYPVESPSQHVSQRHLLSPPQHPGQHPHVMVSGVSAASVAAALPPPPASPKKRKHEPIGKSYKLPNKWKRPRPKLPLQRPSHHTPISTSNSGRNGPSNTPPPSNVSAQNVSQSSKEADSATSPYPAPLSQSSIIVADPEDKRHLAPRICFLRHQLEFFEATAQDVGDRFSKGGTKSPVTEGQIGIRCIHCAHLPDNMRANGAVAYPATLATVYQAVRNWQRHHFMKCKEIPQDLKDEFRSHTRRHSAKAIEYWVASCKRKGLYDGDNTSAETKGIRLLNSHKHSNEETTKETKKVTGNEVEHLEAVVTEAESKPEAKKLKAQIVRRPDATMAEVKTTAASETEHIRYLEGVVAETAVAEMKELEGRAQLQSGWEQKERL